jgi:hypothetical protein
VSIAAGFTYRDSNVDRLFFPTKGRLERKLRHHASEGWHFKGALPWSFWWGPFCAFLVFEFEA